jgi:threonine dehydrogenase-like Zn-dependent dehydrogenase
MSCWLKEGNRILTSRACVLESFGEPIAVREFEVPPHPPGGLIVTCGYGGICGTDLHLQKGHLPIRLPVVLGHEGLGIVHDLDPGLSRDTIGNELRVGDAVMWASSISCGQCAPCRIHREPTLCENRRTCGITRPTTEYPALSGSWAEHICLCEGSTVVKIPDGIDRLAAMALACAGPTMVHALLERRPVRIGEVVVVQGSGPVGLAAAALAQLSGASRVIVVGGPANRLDLARRAGIGDEHVNIVDSSDPQQLLNEVRERTGGKGADLVIECTGVPAAIGQGISLTRRGGSYLVIGQFTDAGETMINPHQIVYRQLDIVGSWGFSGGHVVEYVKLLPALLARFDLRSLVTTYPLDRVNDAMAAVAEASVMKAVLAGTA